MASLLRNKSVSQAFADAHKAPMGSTKRQKAQKLVSVLRKTVTKYDGKGGPGTSPQFANSSPGTFTPQTFVPQPSREMGGMMIFQAPPSPYDGQGGPGYDLSQLNLGASPFGMTGSQFNLGSSTANPFLQNIPNPSAPNPFLTGMPQPSVFGTQRPQTTTGMTIQNPEKLTIGNPMGNIKYDPAAAGKPLPNIQMGGTPSLAPAPTPTTGGAADQSGGPVAPDGTQIPIPDNSGGNMGGDTGGDTYTETGPTPGSFSALQTMAQNALGSNLGPSTFAYGAMNDINVLRELMPGVPDDQLPLGASLTGQIVDIKNALKKEFDIEGMTNRLNSKLQQGSTLDDDLKDYIRGKDEYLNEIDGMLTKAKRTYLAKSGGPDAGVMANYVDYLTTLKGRQNKRYIEFYNGAINQYNGELTTMQNMLQTQTAAYEEELSNRSALKQDDYNRIFGALTEMYNTAADAPRKQLELALLTQQLYSAAGGMGGDAANAISDKWINEFGNLANQGVLIDKETNTFLPSVTSLEPALETIISNNQTNLGGALRIIGEAIGNDLATGGDDVNTYMNKVKKYEKMLIDLKAASMDPYYQERYGADFSPAVDSLAQTLAGISGESISSYVLGNSKKVKEAIRPLAMGGGLFGWGGVPTRDAYIKSNAGSLSQDMLGKLFDYYSVINAADPRGTTMKELYGLPDDQFASTISQGLGQSLFGGVYATSALQGM